MHNEVVIDWRRIRSLAKFATLCALWTVCAIAAIIVSGPPGWTFNGDWLTPLAVVAWVVFVCMWLRTLVLATKRASTLAVTHVDARKLPEIS